MRPDPHQQHPERQSGRIIYIGDVRRRRAARRRAPDRYYLTAFALVALGAWAIWLAVVLSLSPARLLTYLAFFAPLAAALTATGAIVAYGLEWRFAGAPGLRRSTVQGGLLAALVIVNLALLAAHHWVLPVGTATLVAAVVVGIILESRSRQR